MGDINVTSNGQTGGVTAGQLNINTDGSIAGFTAPLEITPEQAVKDEKDLGDLITKAIHERRMSYHKPFHAGKRLLKHIGDYDNGIFGSYNAVPYGRQVKQAGKQRLLRCFDEDEGAWSKPFSLEQFVQRNRAKIRKHYWRTTARNQAHQTMDAVECLRVGQSVYFYFWCWGTLAKRIK